MEKELTLRLVLVIAIFGALTFSGRKDWLKPTELIWVGGAMIFWATGALLQSVLPIVITKYPDKTNALLLSIALVTPVTLALIISLRYLIKKMRQREAGKS